ncbi:hypothetical protein [Alteribacillus bidgolensis]|uniref:Uncharacterized protein n=1 Tax=Alteribacillus bidgolensis TaxID=930129 RepID=A0A1G8FWY2_9BACI|nr:hypothetical protein [Alteribacillus bidgolensis]SDH86575.1 hypothetical protein SAMN05216352_103122 [Alteribacillus bidgolensis]
MAWLGQRKTVTPVASGIVGFVALQLFDNAAGDIITLVHQYVSTPFNSIPFLRFDNESSSLRTFTQQMTLLIIYYVFAMGVKHVIFHQLFSREEKLGTYEDVEEELTEVIKAIDTGDGERIIEEKVTNYLHAVETEIRKVFEVRKRHVDFIWFFPVNEEERYDIRLYYQGKIKDLDSASRMINTALDNEEKPVRQKNSNIKSDSNMEGSKHSQSLIVRNYGEIRLGLGVFFLKDDVISEEKEQEFMKITTNLLLIGFNQDFVESLERKFNRVS